jgi:phosphoribosylaminoimidazole-succinocarboxamide synthase
MRKGEKKYEGKAKIIYASDQPGRFIVYFKDDATAFDGQKKGSIVGKGIVNNQFSNFFFKLLAEAGVPTHFVEEIDERQALVKEVEIFPIEVIIRNVVAGSMSRRLGIEEGTVLAHPTIEYSYKNDDFGDPLISPAYITALGWARREELDTIEKYAFKVNDLLSKRLLQGGMKLIDFKLEFGKTPAGEIVLADEISPDTCRLWDVETNEKLDKDRFRRDLGNVEEAYQEALKRILGL